MATAHLSVKIGKAGKGTPHAEYISRLGKYVQRLNQGEKLEFCESGNMPKWAKQNPIWFWNAADEFERKNGSVYREHEIALPRELNPEQRVELVRQWVKKELGDKHAYTWAIHNKTALDGGEQPHVHLMFSERINDGIERNPEQYFKRYNTKQPERGGARKHNIQGTFSQRADALKAMRERWEQLYNQFSPEKISMKSLKEQGIERKAEPKLTPSESAALHHQAAANRAANEIMQELKAEQVGSQYRLMMKMLHQLKENTKEINKLKSKQIQSQQELDQFKAMLEAKRQEVWDLKYTHEERIEHKSGLFGLFQNKADEADLNRIANQFYQKKAEYLQLSTELEGRTAANQQVQEQTESSLKSLRAERKELFAQFEAIPMQDFEEVVHLHEKIFKAQGREHEFNINYSRLYGELQMAGYRGELGEKIHRCYVVEYVSLDLAQQIEKQRKELQMQQNKNQQPIQSKDSRTVGRDSDEWEMER